jgi:hypothetical protein
MLVTDFATFKWGLNRRDTVMGTPYFRHSFRKNVITSKMRENVLWQEIRLTAKSLKKRL